MRACRMEIDRCHAIYESVSEKIEIKVGTDKLLKLIEEVSLIKMTT